MPPPLQGPPSVCSDASASPHRHRNHHRNASDRNHLAPEDAFFANSPPRWHQQQHHEIANGINGVDKPGSSRGVARSRRRRDKDRGRSGSRRRMKTWKKLLWVKQSYPDNYTDEETFLSQLQRNPRFQPYDFWPLVADSTVIVQHVCSVIIFACCFVGIHQGRISPVSVVSWGSLGTVLGWVMWDWWVGKEEAGGGNGSGETSSNGEGGESGSSASSTTGSVSHGTQVKDMNGVQGLGLKFPTSTTSIPQRPSHSHSASATSVHSNASLSSPAISPHGNGGANFGHYHGFHSQHGTSTSIFSPRNQQRLATAKSAILIYYALLGLSPILKSLTRSTTSDSIWAMSAWLMCINVFFFDYGGEVKFPASLSTNAALMASTVLASRLPSTSHVFSLTLFSIEVFGLFPVFRRHLRRISWGGHLFLTISLVVGAGGGVGVTISGGGWKAAAVGVVLGGLSTAFAMGGCSWWLIGLQKYKNEIHGPWDPARPVIRRHWD